VKITSLRPDDLVLAWNRVACCLHLVPTITTEVIDQYGQTVTDYEEVDTLRGELVRRGPSGKKIIEHGLYYVALKTDAAKALSRR
jgi:hypothetical protein